MKKSPLSSVVGFDWDEANILHIAKHDVTPAEAEEIFSDKNNVLIEDIKHSLIEKRFLIIGKTLKGRLLYQVFTKRGNKIRIISSRNINRKEVVLYEKKTDHSKI
ncbi:BrnT family toxin [Candidatus Roizmanbacteria bacterium]|nr:BrnT family toxin [Candidatus Roizmanbacteria bacterium]